MVTFDDMFIACKDAFGIDCEKKDFSQIFHVYSKKENSGYQSKLVNGYYVDFDKEAYQHIVASEALETGLIRDDYDETKNVIFMEDDGEVRWIYFNPDANSGAQFVENCIYPYLVEKFADRDDLSDEDFFGYLESECKQYLWDCYSIEDYRAYSDVFEASPDTKLDHDLREKIIRNFGTA